MLAAGHGIFDTRLEDDIVGNGIGSAKRRAG